MQYSTALLAFMATAASAAIDGCSYNYDGHFSINVQNVTSEPAEKMIKRQQAVTACGTVDITLEDGILKDKMQRTGNIVANDQFQFDAPLQDPRKADSGFQVCSNGTLGLDFTKSTIFYQCLSGTFYNLYSASQGKQCNQVYIMVQGCQSSGSSSSSAVESGSATATSTSSTSASVASMMPAESMLATQPAAPPATATSTPAATTPAPPVVASTGGAIPTGANGTVTTGAPSSSSTGATAFTGAASSVSVGSFLGLVAVAFAGLAML